jgi:uncharacterized protein (TIGR04255 family)
VKVVSERLGYSSSAFTMTVYQHVLPGRQADAAAAFGARSSAPTYPRPGADAHSGYSSGYTRRFVVAGHREVYPNPPLALAAVEVRFPSEASGLTLNTAQQRRFRDLLLDEYQWVIEGAVQQEVEFAFGPGQPSAQTVRTTPTPRFTVRDRTLAVTAAPESLRVETTQYKGYGGFRPLLETVLAAVAQTSPPDAVSRVGMRYIDEIRVPGLALDDYEAWTRWVHPALVSPPAPNGAGSRSALGPWTGAAQYRFEDDRYLVFRYGPQNDFVVNPEGPVRRRPRPTQGPLFVLDFDSYWEPADLPAFEVGGLMDVLDQLHAPASSMFEACVTDELRSKVFRTRGNG